MRCCRIILLQRHTYATIMLFNAAHLKGIADGRITRAYRRWRRPTVQVGGTLRTSVGVLQIDALEPVNPTEISDEDARGAGFSDRHHLLSALHDRAGEVYRIEFRLVGPDPRLALAHRQPDAGERAAITAKLARLDRDAPWTLATLRAIGAAPGEPARTLAARLDRDVVPFKRDVRKLKELGLTESLTIGYRLTPRGAALLDAPETQGT